MHSITNINQEEKYQEEKYQEEKYQEEKYQEEKCQEENINKYYPNKKSLFVNKHIIFGNNYRKTSITNDEFVRNNLFSNDIDIENKIYNHIINPYQKKLNLINLVLDSDFDLKLNGYLDVIKFFNWLNPLTIEYKMSSGRWNIKSIKYGNREKILLQNSISKSDLDDKFSNEYINKIKKVLNKSCIKYYYFEFKSKRFNKIKDIVWVFDKN
jgi:hypothetical protein